MLEASKDLYSYNKLVDAVSLEAGDLILIPVNPFIPNNTYTFDNQNSRYVRINYQQVYELVYVVSSEISEYDYETGLYDGDALPNVNIIVTNQKAEKKLYNVSTCTKFQLVKKGVTYLGW